MNNASPWPSIEITDDGSNLIRFIAASKRVTSRTHKIPGTEHFTLRKDLGEDSLSFNCEAIADVEMSFSLIGLTFGENGKFIDYTGYVFFRYAVKFLLSLPKFERIMYSPTYHGNPSPLGTPNNKSHTSLYCGDFDIGTRSLLSLYCQDNEETYLKFKVGTIRDQIEALKLRENDTPFHKDWIFEN